MTRSTRSPYLLMLAVTLLQTSRPVLGNEQIQPPPSTTTQRDDPRRVLSSLPTTTVSGTTSMNPTQPSTTIGSGPQKGDVRLVGGRHDMEGRVEIYLQGNWRTISDSLWGPEDARVVCRQLGYNVTATTPVPFGGTVFGWGGLEGLEHLWCSGYEQSLLDCYRTKLGPVTPRAGHAGVSCDAERSLADYSLRLADGSQPWEGRVEIRVKEQWGTVCDRAWDVDDAVVVCRELGYTVDRRTVAIYLSAHFGQGESPVMLENVYCRGSEARLRDCDSTALGRNHFCRHSMDAGVSCNTTGSVGRGDLRLIQGSHPAEGYVEIYNRVKWGAVCIQGREKGNAMVVCQQLGYGRDNTRIISGPEVDKTPSSFVWLASASCTGNESHILDCPNSGFRIKFEDCDWNALVVCDMDYVEKNCATTLPGIALSKETRENPLEIQCPIKLFNAPGSIQTPHFDGQKKYAANVDSCATVRGQEGHVVMTTFIHLDLEGSSPCRYDWVQLYPRAGCKGTPYERFCSSDKALPSVFESNVISVRFRSDYSGQQTGFRLLFSFIPDEIPRPEQLPNGKWNCSGQAGEYLLTHLQCKPWTYCHRKEDYIGLGCPTPYVCGPNIVSIPGSPSCYRHIDHPLPAITWETAADGCLSFDSRLASLNGRTEWDSVVAWAAKTLRRSYLLVGLSQASPHLPDMYQKMWQWSDGTMGTFLKIRNTFDVPMPFCAALRKGDDFLTIINCQMAINASYLCENTYAKEPTDDDVIVLPEPTVHVASQDHFVSCPGRHATRTFLQYDSRSNCRAISWRASGCEGVGVEGLGIFKWPVPTFRCRNGMELVPYTLVCDHRSDCFDNSDEDFCIFPPCGKGRFQCGNQCIPKKLRCDSVRHCVDGSDEVKCYKNLQAQHMEHNFFVTPVQVVYTPDGYYIGVDLSDRLAAMTTNSSNVSLSGNDSAPPVAYCEETEFMCPDNGNCLPVYARCNGVADCPGKQDEMLCSSYTCPGFYRCRDSSVCVHAVHVCDGFMQCPQHDDEQFCDRGYCPANCTCFGHAFNCSSEFVPRDFPGLRYADVSGTGMKMESFAENALLVSLTLTRCGIRYVPDRDSFQNLRHLDLSYNQLTSFPVHVANFRNLRSLSLAFNLITSLDSLSGFSGYLRLTSLNLAGLAFSEIPWEAIRVFRRVRTLNLSGSGLQVMPESGFSADPELRVLDLRGVPLENVSPGLLNGLHELCTLYASNYKLCCPSVLPPGFDPSSCHAPRDEVSSCSALLRSDGFRVFLALYAFLALVGNAFSFVYRVFVKGVESAMGFDVFVTHLCVSDFLMGVYLAIIGIADRAFYGSYEWQDAQWKLSAACQAAGFLSFVSSEVSAFLICLITMERFLVVRFPYKRIRFDSRSAQVACLVAWAVGVLLAAVPFSPPDWHFYSQTGICIPLPITRKVFPGSDYVFWVMIGFNFILFMLIALGQALIFYTIRSSRKAVAHCTQNSKDAAIAKRLLAVVMTDFLCWFPIGLLGLMARNGFPISGDVNVSMAIFVLPFNSALNPFLYTFHMLREQRRRQKRDRSSTGTS